MSDEQREHAECAPHGRQHLVPATGLGGADVGTICGVQSLWLVAAAAENTLTMFKTNTTKLSKRACRAVFSQSAGWLTTNVR